MNSSALQHKLQEPYEGPKAYRKYSANITVLTGNEV
jgi:hypothetical protein